MNGKITYEQKVSPFEQLAKTVNQTSKGIWFQAVIQFTQAVAKRMADNQITRAEMAQRLKVHPSYVTKVLKGDANISVETIAKLSEALKCDFQIDLIPKETFIDESFVLSSESKTITGRGEVAPPVFFFSQRNAGNLISQSFSNN